MASAMASMASMAPVASPLRESVPRAPGAPRILRVRDGSGRSPRLTGTSQGRAPVALVAGALSAARVETRKTKETKEETKEVQETPTFNSWRYKASYVYPFSGGIQAYDYEQPKERYPIDFLRAGYFLFLHVVAFTCGPSTFSLPALGLCLSLFVVLQTLGISLSYHRHLTHRSFQCHKYFEYFIAWCGVLNMQGNPIWWAMNHTWHHRFSDTPLDPHTPREGLWTAHAGWFFEKERVLSKMPEAIVASHNNETEDSSAESWNLIPWFYKESPEFYDWLRQTYYFHQIGQVLALFCLGQVAGNGWSFVVWGFVIRLLLGIHGVSAVNSFAHVWGEKPFKTGDDSRNNAWVAMVSSGEGWHNNHHAFPRSARHGLFPGQFDLTYVLVELLEKIGVVWDLQLPSDAQIKAKLDASK